MKDDNNNRASSASRNRAGDPSDLSRSASQPFGQPSLTQGGLTDSEWGELEECLTPAMFRGLKAEIKRLNSQLGIVLDSHKWLYAERHRLERGVWRIATLAHGFYVSEGNANFESIALALDALCPQSPPSVSDERPQCENPQGSSAEGTPARPSEGGGRP